MDSYTRSLVLNELENLAITCTYHNGDKLMEIPLHRRKDYLWLSENIDSIGGKNKDKIIKVCSLLINNNN
jgi:hypothetical protein